MKKSHFISKLSSFITLTLILFNSTFSLAEEQLNPDIQSQLIHNTRQLTFAGMKAGEGYFSTDGKKMIFQSERYPGNPFYQMYIMDLISGKTQLVSTGVGKTTCGWIHPSMKKAMWSSTHLDPDAVIKEKQEFEQRKNPIKSRYSWSYDEYFDIFESDLNGKRIKRLTKARGYDAEGSYSPDGKEIAFASNRTGYSDPLSQKEKDLFSKDPSSQMEIYIMNSDGSNVRRLTHTLGYDGGPFFSHDGKKITWRRFDTSGMTAEIYTMDKDGTNQKQITNLKALSWAPYYHPSGKYIIFTTSINGMSNFELYIIDSEGLKKPVRVTYQEDFDGLPTFTPDGKKIAWTHRNQKGESQIFLADWDHQKALELLDLNEKFKEKLPSLSLNSQIKKQDTEKILKLIS
ncbi:MAG: PD40 domain-containing protein, partial [Bdellovibrionales bacterium]|nr:PD40 domain-containing protein [Bdellovibrionales bacterium]